MISFIRHRILWCAALILPLIVFGGVWANTHHMAKQGEDWLIPVEGYDPRDLLRGHFIQYRYDWPVEKRAAADPDDGADDFDPSHEQALCIMGAAPNVERVDRLDSGAKQRCAIIARATAGTRREVRGLDRGILYTSQARARALEKKLLDSRVQGLIRVRIRPDGVMRPIDMEFRPRPPGTAAP